MESRYVGLRLNKTDVANLDAIGAAIKAGSKVAQSPYAPGVQVTAAVRLALKVAADTVRAGGSLPL